ncbi:GDP-fucose synthetase [bacterium]|nr:GDP-fucose synthetase [Parcubacteria group bacterium]MBF05421.1 GDP-fucose synthetase [bacterium]|tara:strand:- start:18702 stop:19631 length:930 start_codon:yes stop_codon:yes gene_type:complete
MEKNSKIYIAGHNGLVGSAIMRKLTSDGYTNLVTKSRDELDLLNQKSVQEFFELEKPEYVFLAAAKVGGILANKQFPAEFVYENLQVQNNVIHSAYKNNVTKLLFLGSSCIYPKMAPQPIKEEYLLTSELESSNKAYAIAKIAGITLCQSYNEQYGTNYISLMPTNLYGPGDNFDLESSHVLPALLRKFHEAKEQKLQSVEIWGTGTPKREFLHVDDLADASLFLMENYDDSDVINVGTGEDVAIKELVNIIKEIVDYDGELVWNTSKPDGTPRKLLDVSKLNNLGWKHSIELKVGIQKTYQWYLSSEE